MKLCLENNNPEAHYVEGINQFFFHQRSVEALNHLHNSANGKYNKGTYLCGLLLPCTGKNKEGKNIMDTLDWEHTLSTFDRRWRKIKKTLSVYPIQLEDIYLKNMARLKPPRSCDLQNINHLCKNCYYFIRVEKFVDYIVHR